MNHRHSLGILLTAVLAFPRFGCSSKAATGGAVGAAGGAAVGAVIGNQTGSTTRGAIIGAVVGGVAGTIIGNEMDKQARELEQNIPGARVHRVGEGIAVVFDSGLLFDFDSDALTPQARENLDALAASLNKYPQSDLMIVGHTDNVGSDSYNMDLSNRRAASARAFLRSSGVTRTIKSVGRGEREPITDNESEEGRQQNRRVEVAIYASDAMVQAAEREAAQR